MNKKLCLFLALLMLTVLPLSVLAAGPEVRLYIPAMDAMTCVDSDAGAEGYSETYITGDA